MTIATASSAVRLEREGPLAILTLSRGEARNPLGSAGDGEAFEAVCRQINDDRAVSCAIITGDGPAFSAGGDVKAMQQRSGTFAGGPADIRQNYRGNIHRILRALWGLDTPLIAAVNGPAIGLGCDLACLADIRIASETARFGVTFLALGLIPGDGGAWLLPRAVGQSRAAQMFYTGELIDAQTAQSWGLVSDVAPVGELMDRARGLAAKITTMPPQALRTTKMLLRQAQAATYDQVLELSAASQALMHHTDDHQEGVAALVERRPPAFRGR